MPSFDGAFPHMELCVNFNWRMPGDTLCSRMRDQGWCPHLHLCSLKQRWDPVTLQLTGPCLSPTCRGAKFHWDRGEIPHYGRNGVQGNPLSVPPGLFGMTQGEVDAKARQRRGRGGPIPGGFSER